MSVADVAVGDGPTRPITAEWAARGAAWAVIGFMVFGLPLVLDEFWSVRLSLAVTYAITALSLNVLIGYAGQISLGHQGFFGVGAFMSGYVMSVHDQTFWAGLVAGMLSGAVASLLMGVVALRVRGLYLALVTLVYGRMAEASLFTLPLFGRGAGVEAPRPDGFEGERAYYYLCFAALLVVLYVNWRFTRSRAGRAVAAIRENEQVAASYAVPVARYKLLAFVVAGIFVGLAGGLFGHLNRQVSPQTFDFSLALFFIIVTVVGGLRSPAGIVVWTAAFTLIPEWLRDEFGNDAPFISRAVGAGLLVVVLVFYSGGVGQLIRPVTRWLSGGPFARGEEEYVEEGVRGRP
jgi:branched-chain amino acid transport system permease protein